ncbi:MAG: AAA family ATPase [Cyanobacteria bacterium]|nr:AAA family ATPase [Cyanobacteriota bacterium]
MCRRHQTPFLKVTDPTSGGNYLWPDGHTPADVAEIPPEWWALADVIAKADPQPAKGAKASSRTTSGSDWRRVNPCPICGRDGHLICSKHRDGRSIQCFHGSTFSPPELKAGQVITGTDGEQWAFTGSRKHFEGGEFSNFKIDEPRQEPDYTSGFPDHGGDAKTSQPQGRGDGPQQRQPDPEPLTYTELLAAALEATRSGQADQEMTLRAEIMARFRRSDAQITKALIDLLTSQEGGAVNRSTYGAVDLERTAGMDWQVEGFIPERDQVLIYGEAGAGKTTAAVGLAFAVIDGTGFLDRASRATQGSVLFIASDSGADPLKAALQSMGLMDHPALKPVAEHRLIVWAHDAEQGRLAWDASLRGCIALLDFIRRERPALVIIDSAKAVTSKADLNYCDNAPVTALLTFAKEVLCAHCSIAWLHHDGTAKGSAAGAKAWKEIPSMVHAIEHVEMGGSGDDKGGGGPRNESWKCERMRWWKVRKCRMGTGREFQFELDEGTGRPALIPAAAKTVVQDARAGIVDELWRAWQEGQRSLSRRELIDAMRDQHSYSSKTTDNNLSRMVRARHPEVCRLSIPRGHYKLAPRVVEVLAAAAAQTDTPLITSLLQGKEQGKNPVRESDLVTSREVPEGTRREPTDEPAQASEFPRENLGNCPPASDRNGSGPVPSREVFTPRARGASRQCLKSLWPDPWQQSA